MPDRRVVVTWRHGTRKHRRTLPLREDGRIKKARDVLFVWHGVTVKYVVEWLKAVGATDITITQEANP